MLNPVASDGTAPNQTLEPNAHGDAECVQPRRRLHPSLLRVPLLLTAELYQHFLLLTQKTPATALQCLRHQREEAVIILFKVY